MEEDNGDASYVPELTRIAKVDRKVVSLIMYAKFLLKVGDKEISILTFGPLCVDPDYQAKGIGGELLETTLKLAKGLGYGGIVIFGEPDYYPLHGFE